MFHHLMQWKEPCLAYTTTQFIIHDCVHTMHSPIPGLGVWFIRLLMLSNYHQWILCKLWW